MAYDCFGNSLSLVVRRSEGFEYLEGFDTTVDVE